MGGVIICCSAVLGYLMGHVGTSIDFTRAGVLAVCVTVASGMLGFCDDYLAIRNARNLGLNKLAKFIGLLAIAAIFALLAVYWVHSSTNLSFTVSPFPDGTSPRWGGYCSPYWSSRRRPMPLT